MVPEEGGSLEARSPAPVRLTGGNAFDPRFKKPPRAALVFDVDDGRVLFRREPERVLPIASLTKIMTALAVTSETRPDEKVRITPAALSTRAPASGCCPRASACRSRR